MHNKNKDHSPEKLAEVLKEIGFFESERKVETFNIEIGSWKEDKNNDNNKQ